MGLLTDHRIDRSVAPVVHRFIRCFDLAGHCMAQCTGGGAPVHPMPTGWTGAASPVYPVQHGLLHLADFCADQMHRWWCTGASEHYRIDRYSVTSSSGAAVFCGTRPIHCFLSPFFVFCFAWPFCFIPGIYNCSLVKLISPIDCIVTQSPKSQNNGLMGPCSLQQVKRQKE